MTSLAATGQYLEPLTDEFARRLAQAVCGDDHLVCSWPNCGCRATKSKINAVAAVVAEELGSIRCRVRSALDNQQKPSSEEKQ